MTWKRILTGFLNDLNEKNLKVGIRQEWFNIYPEEKFAIYRFLYEARQHKLFFYLFAIDLQSQVHDLPWSHFLSLLDEHQLSVPKEALLEMSQAIKQKHQVHIDNRDWQQAVNELIKQDQMDFAHRLNERKQELLASARIAESERLMNQYLEYITELKKISPKDHHVQKIITDQEKERAGHIITKKLREQRYFSKQKDNGESNERASWLNQVQNQAIEYLNSGAARPEDLAYLFRSLGDMNRALEFIEAVPDGAQKDWQRLNYLFEGRQYLASLDHCLELRSKYQDSPDALFTICYIESLAYWELGEKTAALELMKQIFEMRPDFKSAGEILRRWQEDSFE